MPKISDARREQRRTQYLDAARRCISRQGIAGTRMEDITAEAGLSSGSTYLYFSTKDDLIRAAIESSLHEFEAAVVEVHHSTTGGLREFLAALFTAAARFGRDDPSLDLYKLAIQGWAFAQTDEQAAALIHGSFDRLVEALGMAVSTRQSSTEGASRSDVARAIVSLLISGVVRRALTVDLDGDLQLRELDALLLAIGDVSRQACD